MKSKFFLMLLFCLFSMFSLVACNVDNEEHTHSYDTAVWVKNDEKHWHECSCGEKSDEAVHVWGEGEVTTEPTEDTAGEKTFTCLCGETKTETIPALGAHTCEFGEEWSSDEEYHWHECSCGEKSDEAAHVWDEGEVTTEPTEDTAGEKTFTCTFCDETKTETVPALGAHTCEFGEEWSYNETHHWHICTGCTEISENAEHIWDNGVITLEPIAGANGTMTFTCTICNATKTEDILFEEIWDSSLGIENFDNVTFRLSGEFSDSEKFDETIMLAGDICSVEDSVSGDPEMVASIKSVYISTVLGVLDNFENFTYDSVDGVYKSNVEIVYHVNVLETDAKITANNVVVIIDADNKLATIVCDMKQEFKEDDTDKELNLHVTFEFSDYGTTVIDHEHQFGQWTLDDSLNKEVRECDCGKIEIRDPEVEVTGITLYLKPNSNWETDDARFAAYFFGNGETWVSMTDEDGDGIYECKAQEGYQNVIFCRMNPSAAANNWDNKWNQTADLTVPTDETNNLYVIEDGAWDNEGYWCTNHDHEFATSWLGDDDYHWHVCTSCAAKNGKAEHDYDEGVVKTEATEDANGVKVFTCSICDHTKEVEYTLNAEDGNRLYLVPNSNWKVDNARFAAYFFGNGETWVSMTDEDGDGIYECEIPTDKAYPNVIFCRMNPTTTANNWNNKWNQTADLTIPTNGTNLYTVKEDTWDKGGGTWSTQE